MNLKRIRKVDLLHIQIVGRGFIKKHLKRHKIIQEIQNQFGDDCIKIEMHSLSSFFFRNSFLKTLTHIYSTDKAVYLNAGLFELCLEMDQYDRRRLLGALVEIYRWKVKTELYKDE